MLKYCQCTINVQSGMASSSRHSASCRYGWFQSSSSVWLLGLRAGLEPLSIGPVRVAGSVKDKGKTKERRYGRDAKGHHSLRGLLSLQALQGPKEKGLVPSVTVDTAATGTARPQGRHPGRETVQRVCLLGG